MSWNPTKPNSILFFEPGCIQCEYCGHKPEDAWETDPEGIHYNEADGAWECDCCVQTLPEGINSKIS